jgi:hypothetical protein
VTALGPPSSSTPLRDRHRESGAALIYVLFLLVLTVTAGSLIAMSLAIEARTRRDDARRIRAAALLDSAAVEAIAELAADPDARGFERHAFGGGEIESEIFVTSATQRAILVSARYGSFERRASVEVVLEAHGPRIVAWLPSAAFGE